MKKIFTLIVVIIIILMHSESFADNHSGNNVHNNKNNTTKTDYGLSVGTSFDVGLGFSGTLAYSLGYVKKQENKNTSIYFLGTYTENIKLGYIVFEKTFHKGQGLFFWGYYFGGGYVKWEYRTFSFKGNREDEKLE